MRDDIKEFNAVEAVAGKFIEAVKSGNSEIVKPYFYEKAVFFGQLNEKEYQAGSIQLFYETIDKMGACNDDYIARTDVLALEKSIAVVRVIEDNWHGYRFT
ncbi:MAG: nuclear transport factor 2 family protein, partial [Candidatus Gastranaerophilales bacterium]|nr:nuclear transport factor 2 family protein [Candidatus Gastranaerophilales bacterium]